MRSACMEREKRKLSWKKWRVLYLMLIPGLVYIVIFNYIPMYGVTIAFKDFYASKGIMGSPWVGLEHFKRVFRSPDFLQILWNTLSLSIYQLLITFPLPIFLALLINSCHSKRFGKFVQNVTYAPYLVSVVVLVGMMMIMFAPRGVFNNIIDILGGERRLFMGDAKYFRHIFVLSAVWQTTGWNSIIYLATLSGVSTELYEAARMDGASKFQRILHIDIPHIVPTIAIILTLNAGAVMSMGFEKAYLMQNDLNIGVSEILSTYVYKKGLLDIDYGYSAAVGLFNNVINLIILLLVNKAAKKITDSSLF
ncbi:sugar ABC transporter permease [Eisenbergiella tayi]|uniref:Sugar ABC transporter permease n=2 Tax=Eisenbergiella tayi TaxID=1432052 RepID=A0ABX3AFG3_9FIRM|nr:sugar ABC transporter permease [Eisenbergiella tayi]ODR54364.1 sugar ABC transporter permease [Eisenbergiella tayi]